MTTTAPGADSGLSDLRGLVAAEVRAWMARRKVTGEALAAALGKSGTTVSRRLRGRTAFDIDDLHQICLILDVSLHQLLLPALEARDRSFATVTAMPGEHESRASDARRAYRINWDCCDSAGRHTAAALVEAPFGRSAITPGMPGSSAGRKAA